jgi:hypothetical protein
MNANEDDDIGSPDRITNTEQHGLQLHLAWGVASVLYDQDWMGSKTIGDWCDSLDSIVLLKVPLGAWF